MSEVDEAPPPDRNMPTMSISTDKLYTMGLIDALAREIYIMLRVDSYREIIKDNPR